MKKLLSTTLLLLFSAGTPLLHGVPGSAASYVDESLALYWELGLEHEVNMDAFRQACEGYYKIENRRKEILVLIDFTKPSTLDRMYIIDMERGELILSSLVSHGRGSGDKYAQSFGNSSGSHKSSLGFYLTGNTYTGRAGFSVRLFGLEKGINDKAFERGIVVHGAGYSNPEMIASSGRLGRSHGCPAVPEALSETIIETIKDGAVMFIYADDEGYLAKSSVLKKLVDSRT